MINMLRFLLKYIMLPFPALKISPSVKVSNKYTYT